MVNQKILYILLFFTFLPGILKAQVITSVKTGDNIYGAVADSRGPIGGGEGYKNLLKSGTYIVNDVDQLLQAMKKAQPGEIVFIPGESIIDLTSLIYIDQLVLEIPSGVTLAGERGNNNSKGAILTSDALKTPLMIRAGGPNVHITGLRIQGPCPKTYADHHRRAYITDKKGSKYYYSFPTSRGISTDFPGIEIDNCEISGFAHAAILLKSGDGHSIHHNFIHHCQYTGLGYGVSHDSSSSVIEYNLFNFNRHSVSGTGKPGCGYIARNNVVLGDAVDHCFDMHGGRSRKDGTNIAGTSIEIYNNTFFSTQAGVDIRGVPITGCTIRRNWFSVHDKPENAIRADDEIRMTVSDNAFGTEAFVSNEYFNKKIDALSKK